MKAVRIHSYGGTEVLCYEEAPRPTPGPGEVLIRVHASSVNPFDIAVRNGYMHGWFNYSFPLILGSDTAGTVEEVGEGVTNLTVGDRVYTRAGVFRDGANAEYTLAFAADVVPVPQSLDMLHSAALPHVTLTAWQALYVLADLSAGQTVLIHGAAGGVGHIATQLAKLRNAKVIGTASVHMDFLSELGVDEAINYDTTRFEDVVKDVDVVLDLIGGDTLERSWQVLKPGGILVSTIQAPAEDVAAAHNVRQGFVVTAPPIGPTLTEVSSLVDSGKLKPHVSTVLPLQEIKTAHQLIEAKHNQGKIVLEVVH
jgi:NADPH:quinone reductase-like Zn-dependent oxidoreductase